MVTLHVPQGLLFAWAVLALIWGLFAALMVLVTSRVERPASSPWEWAIGALFMLGLSLMLFGASRA